jgi:hypothetical protein
MASLIACRRWSSSEVVSAPVIARAPLDVLTPPMLAILASSAFCCAVADGSKRLEKRSYSESSTR